MSRISGSAILVLLFVSVTACSRSVSRELIETLTPPPTLPVPAPKPFATIVPNPDGTFGMSNLNGDYKRRDELLGVTVTWGQDDIGGIAEVASIPLPLFETLFAENFNSPDDQQNAAPTAKQFLEFVRKYPDTIAFGYVASPDRSDYRTSIEGIYVPNPMSPPNSKSPLSNSAKTRTNSKPTPTLCIVGLKRVILSYTAQQVRFDSFLHNVKVMYNMMYNRMVVEVQNEPNDS